jgi:hypothetical protein
MISPVEALVLEDTTVLDDELVVELDDEVVSLIDDEDNEDEGVVLELVVDSVDTGATLLVLDVDADDDVGCTAQDDWPDPEKYTFSRLGPPHVSAVFPLQGM